MRKLIALLFVLLAQPAYAGQTNITTTPAIQASLQMAKIYWQERVPACPTYTVWQASSVSEMNQDADGTTEPAAGQAEQPGCSMLLSPITEGYSISDLCAAVTHEYGHSLGQGHTTNIYDVMDPAAAYTTGMPPECQELEEELLLPRPHVVRLKPEGYIDIGRGLSQSNPKLLSTAKIRAIQYPYSIQIENLTFKTITVIVR